MTEKSKDIAGIELYHINRKDDAQLENSTLSSQFNTDVDAAEIALKNLIKDLFVPEDISLLGRNIWAELYIDTQNHEISFQIVEANEEGNVTLKERTLYFSFTIDAEDVASIIEDLKPKSGRADEKKRLAQAVLDVYNAHRQAFARLPRPKPELPENDDLDDNIGGSPIVHCYINLNGGSMIKTVVDRGFNPASRTEERISDRIIVTHPSCAGRKLELSLMMDTEDNKDEIRFLFLEHREYTGQEDFDFNEAAQELYDFTLSLHEACGEAGWDYYYRKKSTGTVDVPIMDQYDAEEDDRRINNMHRVLGGQLAKALKDKGVIGIGGDTGYAKEIARNLIAIFTEYKSLANNDHLLKTQIRNRLGLNL